MPSPFTLFISLLSIAIASTNAQTVVDDSSSEIIYSTNPAWVESKPCIFTNGTLESGQHGCINVVDNCTDGVMLASTFGASASFTFQGTGISYFGVRNFAASLLTVAVDGNSTDVDAFDPSGVLVCKAVFSKTGLAPGVNHTITVTLKGVSPQDNSSTGGGVGTITVDQFIVTTANSSSDSSSSGTSSASSSASSPSSSNASSRNTAGVSAGLVNFILAIFLACTTILVVL